MKAHDALKQEIIEWMDTQLLLSTPEVIQANLYNERAVLSPYAESINKHLFVIETKLHVLDIIINGDRSSKAGSPPV